MYKKLNKENLKSQELKTISEFIEELQILQNAITENKSRSAITVNKTRIQLMYKVLVQELTNYKSKDVSCQIIKL